MLPRHRRVADWPVLMLAVMLSSGLAGCGQPQREPVWLGTAVLAEQLQTDPRYAEIVRQEFDMVTPELAMKFDVLQPARGEFDFEAADAIVDFAEQHGLRVRGHVLVWHHQLPTWLEQGHFTRPELIAILREHITTVVERYRGRIHAWDVVNEAVDPAGPDGLRNTFWLRGIGPEYIRLAFEWAHAADPAARLYYNDYGAEHIGPKFAAVKALAVALLDANVPLHGIGLQAHLRLVDAPDRASIEQVLQHWRRLGLQAEITEMDVQIQGAVGNPDDLLVRQADVYASVAQACFNSANCRGFSTWGFTDRHSWIAEHTGNADAPLLFDSAYQPKPAYHALVAVLGPFRPDRTPP